MWRTADEVLDESSDIPKKKRKRKEKKRKEKKRKEKAGVS